MSAEADKACFICDEATASVEHQWDTRDCYCVKCPVCGWYFLDVPLALTKLPWLPDKHLLSAAARRHWEETSEPLELLAEDALTDATNTFAGVTTLERAEMLLEYLVRCSDRFGQAVGVRHETDYPLGACHDGEELRSLLRHLHEEGYIDWPTVGVNGVWPYVVTVAGTDKIKSQKPRIGFHPDNT